MVDCPGISAIEKRQRIESNEYNRSTER
jgi:hypothetical protein